MIQKEGEPEGGYSPKLLSILADPNEMQVLRDAYRIANTYGIDFRLVVEFIVIHRSERDLDVASIYESIKKGASANAAS